MVFFDKPLRQGDTLRYGIAVSFPAGGPGIRYPRNWDYIPVGGKLARGEFNIPFEARYDVIEGRGRNEDY